MEKSELTKLRDAIEHATSELQDVYDLVDAYGTETDLETLYSYTQMALGAVGDLDELAEKLKNAEG